MRNVTIARQFRGPPNSGNGGYVCGLIGREIAGPSTVALRALIPLDVPLALDVSEAGARLLGADGSLIAEGSPTAVALPEPPAPPSLEEARDAGTRCLWTDKPFHPPCFTCSSIREEGDGLRILPGQSRARRPDISPAFGRRIAPSPARTGACRTRSCGRPSIAPARWPGS